MVVLTITAHANGDAFLQATILTAVAIDAQNAALLVLRARTILDFLLDGAPEEALCQDQRKNKHIHVSQTKSISRIRISVSVSHTHTHTQLSSTPRTVHAKHVCATSIMRAADTGPFD